MSKNTNQNDFFDKIIINVLQSSDKKNFSQKEKTIFFKELSYLLKWWVSLNESTIILQTSTDNFALKDMVTTIQHYINKGMPLSFALSRLPDFFDEWDIAVIKTWEASGKLPIVLEQLASEYEYTSDIKNKYIGAMLYPIILLLVSIVAVISLFVLVLPSILSIADGFQNLELPWATQMLRNISTFLETNRKWILRTTAWLTGILWLFFSTDKWKKIWFNFLLQIPLIGKMTQYYYVVKFCRYMKLMNSSWMNYIQTFQLLKDILWVPAYQEMLDNIISSLKEWKDIYSSIKHETTLIPSDVAIMIKVWEQTASLEQSLKNILTMYESELNVSINRLSKVIEPIMLIWIGWVVVVIAYAVFWIILQIMAGVWA